MRIRLSTIGLALALAFLGCNRLPSGPRYMQIGKRLLERKDYNRAVLELRKAVEAMPRDPEALYQLALAYVGTAKPEFFPLAVKSLRRALDLNPKHAGARLELARLEALTRDQEVVADAESLLKDLLAEDETNVDALQVLGMVQFKLGKKNEAEKSLSQVLSKAPKELGPVGMLAIVKMSQNNTKGAEEVLQKALAGSPQSVNLLILLGRMYSIERKLPEAAEQFKRAVEIAPNNIEASALLGETELALKQFDDAERIYKRLSALGGKETKHLYAMFLFERGRREEAVRELKRLADEDKNDLAARTRLVAAYYAIGRMADAQQIVSAALARNRKDIDALIQRAQLRILDGNYTEAELDLNQALRLKPDSAEAHYVLARVHKGNHRDPSYRQQLSETLRLQPLALAVRVELAQALRSARDPKAALHVIEEAPRAQASSLALLAQRNWALWDLGDLAEMRKGIDSGLSHQKSAEFLIEDGYWKLQNRDYKGAVRALEAALELSPDNVVAMEGLRIVHVAQGQGRAGVEKVKAYAAKRPKSALVQEYLGKVLFASGDQTGARAALTAAKAADSRSVSPDLTLVQLDIAQKKLDDAAEKLRRIVSRDPRNSVAYLWLGNLAATKGDYGAATANYRKAVELDPNNASALNNLAYCLGEYSKDLDSALKLAQQAKERAPDEPTYSDTLGWILYRRGVYEGAVRQLEHAVAQKHENRALFRYHLAMAYFKAGERVKAKATFETALKENPNIPEAKSAQELFASVN